MGKQAKVSGKVHGQNGKYKIDKGNGPDEVDVDIDIPGGGNYEVDKLEVVKPDGSDVLPKTMPDGTSIRWFNNFSIKQNGKYIKKKYKVTIPDLIAKLKEKNSQLVIYSETHDPNLYYLDPQPAGDTFELDEGDPGTGQSP